MRRYFFSLMVVVGLSSVELHAAEDGDKSTFQSICSSLVPHYARAQFAGSMGVVSLGTGWTYGRQSQWESDLAVGIVPKGVYDKCMVVSSIKQSYYPWDIVIKDSPLSVTPLTCGVSLSAVWDENFWWTEPDKYNPPYYRFSTRMRLNMHLGMAFNYKVKQANSRVKTITAYYEFSSSDLEIISAAINSYLKPKDYLSLAFGVKVRFK